MTLGERVKWLRTSLNMTQKEFGAKIGVSSVSISTTESGKTTPDEQTIRLLCSTYNIRRGWLEDGDGDPELPEAEITEFELRYIFDKQTDEELKALARLMQLPNGCDMLAKFAVFTMNGLDEIRKAEQDAEEK